MRANCKVFFLSTRPFPPSQSHLLCPIPASRSLDEHSNTEQQPSDKFKNNSLTFQILAFYNVRFAVSGLSSFTGSVPEGFWREATCEEARGMRSITGGHRGKPIFSPVHLCTPTSTASVRCFGCTGSRWSDLHDLLKSEEVNPSHTIRYLYISTFTSWWLVGTQ